MNLLACALLALVVDFSQGRWDPSAWTDLRQPQSEGGAPFVQGDYYVENWSDAAWSDEDVFRKHQLDAFSCMVLTNRFSAPMTFTAMTRFEHRMAPAIVIASDVATDAQGRKTLGDHYEIVLSDEGLCVWRHGRDADGRPLVEKVAYLNRRFEPKVQYALTVTVERQQSKDRAFGQMTIRCDGETFGFRDPLIPSEFHAGIAGSKGRCRFYGFRAGATLEEAAVAGRYRPITQVRVNQVGYAPGAPKVAEVPESAPYKTFRVQWLNNPRITWEDVMEGTFSEGGGGFKYADFSSVTKPGDYRVVCGAPHPACGCIHPKPGSLTSFSFKIADGVYSHLQRVLFGFYTWQRCGSGKGWAGVCHQDPVPLVGTDRKIDMRGGYHQSCDLRAWADDTARGVWQLFRWAENAKPAWDDGIVDEELRWGAEYFAKLVGPEGWAYDCQFEPIGWGPRNYYLRPAPLSAQYCVLHVLTSAARRFKASDSAFAATCLAKAKAVYAHTGADEYFKTAYTTPIPMVPPGSQPASFYRLMLPDNANGVGSRASAAIELYLTTGEEDYRKDALALGGKLLAFQIGEGPKAGLFRVDDDANRNELAFYACCCGAGDFGTTVVRRLFELTGEARFKEAYRRQCDAYLRFMDTGLQSNRGTGVVTGRGLALLEGYRLFGNREYYRGAQRAIDWMLGANRFEASMVNGVGLNQQQLEVFGQFFPSTPWIPGAVTHVVDGEYNLPNAGSLLLLAQALDGESQQTRKSGR